MCLPPKLNQLPPPFDNNIACLHDERCDKFATFGDELAFSVDNTRRIGNSMARDSTANVNGGRWIFRSDRGDPTLAD